MNADLKEIRFMKGFFKHVVLTFAALLTLTACDSLLLMPSARRNGSSKDNDEQMSSFKKADEAPDDRYITFESDPLYIPVDQTFNTVHHLCYEKNNANYPLNWRESYAVSLDNNLEVTSDCFSERLEVVLYTKNAGNYQYEVHLISSDGYEYTKVFSVIADNSAASCYVEMDQDYKRVPVGQIFEVYFRIYNPVQGQAVLIDQNNPCRFTRHPYGLNILRCEVYDPAYVLAIQIQCDVVETNFFEIEIQSYLGTWYSAVFTYEIYSLTQPQYYVYCEVDPIVAETGGYADLCFYLGDNTSGNTVCPLDTSYWAIEKSNDDFSYVVLEIEESHIKIRFQNTNSAGGATDFDITLTSETGNRITSHFVVYSSQYYNNALSMEFYIKMIDETTCDLTIVVNRMNGQQAMIKLAHIKARYGIVCDEVTIDNINSYGYDYYFTVKGHGDDVIDVDIVTSDGISCGSGIYVSL